MAMRVGRKQRTSISPRNDSLIHSFSLRLLISFRSIFPEAVSTLPAAPPRRCCRILPTDLRFPIGMASIIHPSFILPIPIITFLPPVPSTDNDPTLDFLDSLPSSQSRCPCPATGPLYPPSAHRPNAFLSLSIQNLLISNHGHHLIFPSNTSNFDNHILLTRPGAQP